MVSQLVNWIIKNATKKLRALVKTVRIVVHWLTVLARRKREMRGRVWRRGDCVISAHFMSGQTCQEPSLTRSRRGYFASFNEALWIVFSYFPWRQQLTLNWIFTPQECLACSRCNSPFSRGAWLEIFLNGVIEWVLKLKGFSKWKKKSNYHRNNR